MLTLVAALTLGVQNRPFGVRLAPRPPKFPDFGSRDEVVAEARRKSERLQAYIERWLGGKAPARIPDDLLMKGDNREKMRSFTLVRPEDVRPKDQFMVRPARDIDLRRVIGQYPDPHCTYLLMPMLAPFGTKVVVEGEFPHARFFNLQITPSFTPEGYHNGYYGVPEVPLVDADMTPEPGSTNPFRPGADRTAKSRRYRAEFDLRIGDPVALNRGAYTPPNYRASGNSRVGGAIFYQGPGQLLAPKVNDWRDRFESGNLWIRYYAPDRAAGPMAGVPMPKARYVLPDGREFFVRVDLDALEKDLNLTREAPASAPEEPNPAWAKEGWGKQFGIFRTILAGIAQFSRLLDARYVREYDLGVEGKGEDQPGVGAYEKGSTECNYITYMVRSMALGPKGVAVLTGRLPTTPKTRGGEPTMERAQARYWSLTGYSQTLPSDKNPSGSALHSLMDDEVVTDRDGRYVIALSRREDRPKNARPENGVTWVEWGPSGRVGWTLRWLAVPSEWSFAKTPHQGHLGWATDWAAKIYDPSLLNVNDESGFLGEYQPILHYLGRDAFERLGDRVRAGDVPIWK